MESFDYTAASRALVTALAPQGVVDVMLDVYPTGEPDARMLRTRVTGYDADGAVVYDSDVDMHPDEWTIAKALAVFGATPA